MLPLSFHSRLRGASSWLGPVTEMKSIRLANSSKPQVKNTRALRLHYTQACTAAFRF
jgi:hypothetical protein